VTWLKLILTILSLYIGVTSSIPVYWILVALYWFLNFLIDVIKN